MNVVGVVGAAGIGICIGGGCDGMAGSPLVDEDVGGLKQIYKFEFEHKFLLTRFLNHSKPVLGIV